MAIGFDCLIVCMETNGGLYIVHSPTNALFIKLGKVQIYVKIHIIIAPTYFGLRPSSGNLYRAWLKLHFC